MKYYDFNGELVNPSTEDMAYEQTNHRIDVLEENINSDIEATQQNIDETATSIGDRITSEIDTVNNRITDEISTLESRVDSIIAHNNDTEGNSELIDIRTDADGIIYASAGNAIRVTHNKLKSAFDSVTESESVFTEVSFGNTVAGKYMTNVLTEAEYSEGAYGTIIVHSGEKYKIRARVGINVRTYVIADTGGNVTRYADTETWRTIHDYDTEITIASSEDGGTLYVSTIDTSYFGLKKETQVYVIDKGKIPDFPENPLLEKTAVFNGDSICAGQSVGSGDPTYGYGWAGRIGTKNRMTWKNYGVGGGTVTSATYFMQIVPAENVDFSSGQIYYIRIGSIASGTDTMYLPITENEWDGTSALLIRGNPRHWESTDIDTMYNEYPHANYVILESCLNDGFTVVPKGTLDPNDFSPTVTTNFTSAMEYMLNRAITLFPNAKIGVIIPHRVINTNIEAYHTITRTICEKWGIPCLDLYKESGLCVNNQTQAAVMFSDGNTHLTAEGYDMITSKIEAWMKTL